MKADDYRQAAERLRGALETWRKQRVPTLFEIRPSKVREAADLLDRAAEEIEQLRQSFAPWEPGHPMNNCPNLERVEKAETRYEAAKDACEELAQRYGATVEWDEEGLAQLTMPSHPEEAARHLQDRLQRQINENVALRARYEALRGAAQELLVEAESMDAQIEGEWVSPKEWGQPHPIIEKMRAALQTPEERAPEPVVDFDGVKYICPDCGIERVDANTPKQARLCPGCNTLAKPFLEVRPPRVLLSTSEGREDAS